jgi:hypothetical protein
LNIHHMLAAVESIDEAITFTIDPKERAELFASLKIIQTALAKRGVFVGTKNKPEEGA